MEMGKPIGYPRSGGAALLVAGEAKSGAVKPTA